MKRIGYREILMLIFLTASATAEAQKSNFEDGFEDGDFTDQPAWSGDTNQFEIVNRNGNHLLRLNSADAKTASLSTPSRNLIGFWEFYVEFDGFEPSGSNRAEIFLVSDRADLEGAVDGYAVRVGQSGDDMFKLVRYDNGTLAETLLRDTTVVGDRGGGYRVKVTRDEAGNWQMAVGSGYAGKLHDAGYTAYDEIHTTTAYFGFKIDFTSSRSDRFYFDFRIDLPPFKITGISAEQSSVWVSFNRPFDQASIDTDDFVIDQGMGDPTAVQVVDDSTVKLVYGNALPSDTYTLRAEGISDLNGQPLTESNAISFIIFDTASYGDILINEFRYDPPGPGVEYVELLNRTGHYLNLQDLQFGDSNGLLPITENSRALEPGGYLVLTSDSLKMAAEFGPGPYVEWRDFPALNNGGDLIQLGDNKGGMIDSLTYQPSWGGDERSLERRSAEVLSVYRENWDNSIAPGGGTPGRANSVKPDNNAPLLIGLNITDSTSIQLLFNERIQQGSAEQLDSYRITTRSITEARWISPDSVQLRLTPALENATDYTLSINGVQDLFSNTMQADSLFTYYRISPADSGNIFINEFAPDPPDGLTEFIELYNPTRLSYDLKGWSLTDNTGRAQLITDRSVIFPPESYLVLVPDSTIELQSPGLKLITLGHRFPALNNSGDHIIIRRPDGNMLDSLQYRKSWVDRGGILERKTVTISGIHRENWGRSPRSNGTPGKENAIQRDLQAPVLQEVSIRSPSEIALVFSETIYPASAADTEHFSLDPPLPVDSTRTAGGSIELYLGGKMRSGQRYTLTIEQISDIFGNRIKPRIESLRYIRFSPAEPGNLVINEFLNLEKDGEGEFVELLNRSDKFLDLSGWLFGDAVTTTVLPHGTVMEPNSYLVLTDDSSFLTGVDPLLNLPGFPSLNQRSDVIYLGPPGRQPIDSLFYQDWKEGSPGRSFERRDPLSASADPSNWAPSESPSSHSAGKENSVYQPDRTPPALVFATLDADGLVELRFEEFVKLNGDTRFQIAGNTAPIAEFNRFNANRIRLKPTSPISDDQITHITVEQLSDIRGNLTGSASIPLALPMKMGSLAVNEIMFNPLQNPVDHIPDQTEYIELINRSRIPVSMEGLLLHEEPDEKGKIRPIEPLDRGPRMIRPGHIVLIYADKNPQFPESDLAQHFNLENLPGDRLLRVDRSTLGLSSSNDAIYLSDSTGITVDSVFYDESWHNPNLVDTRGIALERIDPNGPSNSEANWGSSSNRRGGTPAAGNSIYQDPGDPPSAAGIEFTPNPFSPDGDGFEDRLFINYTLDQPDYLLNIRIYDRYGRLVKRLADGLRAGTTGTVIWDGRNDRGRRNRIGIYIILFEANDPASSSKKVYKKTVVIARRF